MTIQPSRRTFIKIAAGTGAGLIIGLELRVTPVQANAPFAPNPFVRIAPDNTVTVIVKHLDKGQGVATGLSTLVAEELDADWSQIRAEFAPADASKYNNLLFGPFQGTGGSTSIANSFDQYRKAGAIARAMLVAAAAAAWGVPAAEIVVAQGVLSHKSGRSGTFGEFAEKAAELDAPKDAPLKDAKDFIYIGKSFKRLDTAAKITGQPIFTQDIHLDGMVVAAIIHPPRFGAVATKVDASQAQSVKGFLDAKIIPQGVAVYATGTWPAFKAKGLVKVDWDEAKAEKRGTAELLAEYRKLAQTPGLAARNEGDANAALAAAAQTVEAEFVFPYLAHAAMEPMNAVVQFDGDKVRIWTGSQLQTMDQIVAGAIFGVPPAKVDVVTRYAGGSFGRRAVPTSDYVAEAAVVAKAWGKPDPVKLVWQREDDMKAGYYRPFYVHQVAAGLDAAGNLVAWRHRIVGQSILGGTAFEKALVKDGVDPTSVEYQRLSYYVNLRKSRLIAAGGVAAAFEPGAGPGEAPATLAREETESAPIQPEQAPNTITFDNTSGKDAVVKLVGPSQQTVQVPNGELRLVHVAAGEYYFLVRYGVKANEYTYQKSPPFNITQTETQHSAAKIRLEKGTSGNLGSSSATREEFERSQ